jgi:competence protein ComK
MFIYRRYIIRDKMKFMIGQQKRNGDFFTLVVEQKRELLVERHPEDIIEDTLNYFGFDTRGAVKSAGTIIGEFKMSPFIVNPNNTVCLLPAKSPLKGSLIYFNIQHIDHTAPYGKGTIVICSDDRSIIIPSRPTHFQTKVSTADKLRKTIINRNNGNDRIITFRYCRDTGSFIIHNDGDPE